MSRTADAYREWGRLCECGHIRFHHSRETPYACQQGCGCQGYRDVAQDEAAEYDVPVWAGKLAQIVSTKPARHEPASGVVRDAKAADGRWPMASHSASPNPQHSEPGTTPGEAQMTPDQHARAPFIAGMLYGLAIRQSRAIEPQDIPDLKAAADLLLAYHADADKAQEHKAMFEQAWAIVNRHPHLCQTCGQECHCKLNPSGFCMHCSEPDKADCTGPQLYLNCREARPDEPASWCTNCQVGTNQKPAQ